MTEPWLAGMRALSVSRHFVIVPDLPMLALGWRGNDGCPIMEDEHGRWLEEAARDGWEPDSGEWRPFLDAAASVRCVSQKEDGHEP